MKGDNAKALAFLQRAYPEGPWALTAIAVDKKSIETVTFGPSNQDSLLSWLEEYNGLRNIYWHVNPVRYPVSKKAERADIKEVCYLHVDVDPREGQPIEAERERILKLFTKALPKGVPEPTCIIFSGGGYQGFWKLQTPIPINGELVLAEEAKRYNQHLELLFGADNCHNIDRLMRLPGTLNLPDVKKQKKGRVTELAKVLHWSEHDGYALNLFTSVPQVKVKDPKESFGGETIYDQCKVKVSGNVPRLDSIDELDEWNVPDRIKIVCVQGRHPEQPKQGDNSRSAWLYDCVCNLVRFNVPDEIIYSIITDPGFGISESVLEMKGKAEAYAIRQIEQAKETAINPMLRDLNLRYAVISNLGGKCRIIERIDDSVLNRKRVTKQSFEDFRNSHMNRLVEAGTDKDGKPKYVELGKWWLHHPQRRQYRSLVFAPGREVKDGYNLWDGFAVQPAPGDCLMLLDHVKRNICSNNDEHYNYLISWMARAVQHPASPGETAIVLRGPQGVGKSFLADMFGKLWGTHYMVVTNSSHLVGNFNAHLRDVCFLFADEAFFAGDKKHTGILRSLITAQSLALESKGVDVEMGPNYLHIMMASNERHVIPAGRDERRYLVLDVGSDNHQDSTFFGALKKHMEKGGGYEAFLHFLLTHDISGFDVRNVPKTAALREQKELSMSNEEEWWKTKLTNGFILDEHDGWVTHVPKAAVIDDYINQVKLFNSNRRGSETQLGRFLKHIIKGLVMRQMQATVRVHVGGGVMVEERKRIHHYVFPPLKECRDHWDSIYGPQEWDPEPVQTELVPPVTTVPF